MASGLPVVVNNDSIRREIIGNSGILVDPENEIQYSQALVKALKSDWKNRPVFEASRFSWNKISDDYENLFKSLIQE
jgi:glycosyltransferase involved in cell wall biosynthesis